MELAKAASSSNARAAGLAPAMIKYASLPGDPTCKYYAEAHHFVTRLGSDCAPVTNRLWARWER